MRLVSVLLLTLTCIYSNAQDLSLQLNGGYVMPSSSYGGLAFPSLGGDDSSVIPLDVDGETLMAVKPGFSYGAALSYRFFEKEKLSLSGLVDLSVTKNSFDEKAVVDEVDRLSLGLIQLEAERDAVSLTGYGFGIEAEYKINDKLGFCLGIKGGLVSMKAPDLVMGFPVSDELINMLLGEQELPIDISSLGGIDYTVSFDEFKTSAMYVEPSAGFKYYTQEDFYLHLTGTALSTSSYSSDVKINGIGFSTTEKAEGTIASTKVLFGIGFRF